MLRLFLEGMLDLLWPPRTTCLLCEERLQGGWPAAPGPSPAEGLPVCPACWAAMPFAPGVVRCANCSRPLAGGQGICVECAEAPLFGRVWALGLHQGALREAIHHLKFGGRRALGPALGAMLAARVQGAYDLIVPIPLHPSRLRERGYNQAALIAQGLSHHLCLPVADGELARIRPTGYQARLDREERLRNLREAFGRCRPTPAPWRGRAVLLVDDVLTTGATAAAAAEVLHRTGAAWVDLAVLAVSDKRVAPAPTAPGRRGPHVALR